MPVRNEIGHDQARQIINAIIDELETTGKGAAAAVVDPHGEMVAFCRSDGCPLPSIDNAVNKAFTASREKVESKILGDKAKKYGYPLAYFGDPRYIGWGGGVPIVIDGEVIGAVGVSGLSAAEDIELARLGISAIADG